MKIHTSLYTILLLIVALLSFRLLLPAEAAPPAAELLVSGTPEAASGIITSGVSSRVMFSTNRHNVWFVNDTGGTAYFKVNPGITDTVSPADFQFVLYDKQSRFFDNWLAIRSAAIYVTPSTGITTFGPEEATLAGYDDLDDFDGATYSPPISADRQTLNDFSGFSQHITVENVDGSNFAQVVGDHTTYFVRITVDVSLNSEQISSASWIRARY